MPQRPFERLFYISENDVDALGVRLQRMLVDVILDSSHPIDRPLPSTRNLARQLGIARATVTTAYTQLVHQGLLLSKQRSGYFINPCARSDTKPVERMDRTGDCNSSVMEGSEKGWAKRLQTQTREMRNIAKPKNWNDFPYPFISGQADPYSFPIAEWRHCSRLSLRMSAVHEWISDSIIEDSRELIEQIRKRLLSRRGINAQDDEILITLGSQNALYLLSQALMEKDTVVGMETPGYPDARNIFSLRTNQLRHIQVDGDGIRLEPELADCSYLYVTPSHQAPTTVTMSLQRRQRLLEMARANDVVILEDDYDSEVNFDARSLPALKSMDTTSQVIYFSSLSKSLAPGLRVGYIVAPTPLINELRALRRLMFRHPPTTIQHTLAIFLAQGSHDALASRQRKVHHRRWLILNAAMREHLVSCKPASVFGGSSAWVQGPPDLDGEALAEAALHEGIVIEPGAIYFAEPATPCRWFRLGFSAIPDDRIEDGIRALESLIVNMTRKKTRAPETPSARVETY